jgi:chromosome segregation ATPase
MRLPMKSEEELLSAAEVLHAGGELSVDRLKRVAGGGQRERLMAIVRRVREVAADRTRLPADAEAAAAEPELPGCLREGLARVAADIVRELVAVRATELDRARATEAAAAARHEAAIRAAETNLALLNEDLAACEAEVGDLRAELERLAAEADEAKKARTTAEYLRQSEIESHSRERLTLTDALSRAQEEVARQGHGRSRAEAEAAAAGATARAAAAELERVRQEGTALRAQCESLLRQLGATEIERDRALQDLRTMTADSSRNEAPDSAAPSRRRSRRQRITKEA